MAANMALTIQNLMTTFVSLQPFFSKWWCRGAMRKMRLPVKWKLSTWRITETASTMKMPPMTSDVASVLVSTARAAKPAPSASEPVSPMKIDAG